MIEQKKVNKQTLCTVKDTQNGPHKSACPTTCSSLESDSSSLSSSSSLDWLGAAIMSSGFAYLSQYSVI